MPKPQKVSTCLWFDSDGEEAVNFYTSLIEDSKVIRVTRYGPGMPMPDGTAMLVNFTLGGTEFAALNGGPMFKASEAASIVVACDSQKEIDRLWSALTAKGGAESQCGWLKDRYGVSWQIIPAKLAEWMDSKDKAAFGRVMTAIMPMKKLDIAKLEAAFAGK